MKYTQQQLDALSDAALDKIVGKALWGDSPPRVMGWHTDHPATKPILPLSSTWDGFGRIVERMNHLGWTYDVDATAPELGIDVYFHPKNPAFRGKGVGSTLPRAAAIAAILVTQAAEEFAA